MDKLLEQIKLFADQAHGDQMRKYEPSRYIVHPIRVMETTKEYTNSVPVLAAAILHDVIEDTDTSIEEIRAFVGKLMAEKEADQTAKLVHELTDVYTKQKFPQWNRYKRKRKEAERLEKASGEAQTIKYADIIDNAAEIAKQDPDFARRYLEEARELLRRMKKGNQQLRHHAIESIKRNFRELKEIKAPGTNNGSEFSS